jgi:chromosome segregation ATPase
VDKQPDDLDEDVVVIEQRDKKTYLYIGLAAVLGIAVGGLIGGMITVKQWESAYQALETRFHHLESENQEKISTTENKNKKLIQQLKNEFNQKLESEKSVYQDQLKVFNQELDALKQANAALKSQMAAQKTQLSQASEKNAVLDRQANLQASLLERSRELFQREFKVKQSLVALEKEKETLTRKVKSLQKECDEYLQGTSWNAHSDACNQQDAASERIKKVNQLIRVNQMDLKQIQVLTKELGVD